MSSLRLRKDKEDDLESGVFSTSPNHNNDQGTLLSKITQLQQRNRELEKSLITSQNQQYSKSPLNDDSGLESRLQSGSTNDLYDRGRWLIGLLVLQSCSSFILANYEKLLAEHQALIYFLTMLVGAGGNAGNQACVKMVRELAIGRMTPARRTRLLLSELRAAVILSILLGIAGLVRSILSSQTSYMETFVITVALVVIVFVSIAVGATLPFLFHYFKLDPAHSSTTIQVFMDITGVLLLCFVASLLL
mmetsp:Transcript_12893/g.21056  ORF Transcript_12893/g.21056 Transcript_12893/m.21056 type:complete len:248 (-) Transcript_12893:118-861(-)